jgi:hypothetical protein
VPLETKLNCGPLPEKEGLFFLMGGVFEMFRAVKNFLLGERGAILTMENIIWALVIAGAAAGVGYGVSAALRGLAGKNVLIIKCSDPAYANDPRCSQL